MSITVVIPSYKHADVLANTLNSISRQTALSAIDKIIISENSDDVSAKAVCDLFNDLPIEYIQNTTIKGMVANWAWVIDQSKSLYTAMLHDDDWWYPTHLENALKALENPAVGSYFSNFIFSKDEKLNQTRFHFLLMNFLGDKIKSPLQTIELNFEEVATLSYLYTPFHMSCLVAKTSILQNANDEGLRKSDGWNADRSLYPHLALKDNIAFSPQFLCAVRSHTNQYSYRLATENQQRNFDLFQSMSEYFIELASTNGVDILSNWKRIKDRSTFEEWTVIVNTYNAHFGKLHNSLFQHKKVSSNTKSVISVAKQAIKTLTPYGLVKLRNK
jgi:glycosyltransferase involved in cell wall biosynthesis